MDPVAVPSVPPIASGFLRPRWSVMIPTYNCADYLEATLAGVLAQDPGPDVMQIEVIDDCSTADRPEDVVADVGRDRVAFRRQAANVGIAGNLTACLNRSTGLLVHVLHGDDLVRPGFYATVGEMMDAQPHAVAAAVGCEDVDETGAVILTNPRLRGDRGVPDDFVESIFAWNPVRAPSLVVRRSAYEAVGGFRHGLRFCADWDMWKRIALHGPVVYDPEVLAGYRVHDRSDTAQLATSVSQLREMLACVRLAHGYLPGLQTHGWTKRFYGHTRRWSWRALRDGHNDLSPRDRLDYAVIAAESIARQQADRLVTAPARRRQA